MANITEMSSWLQGRTETKRLKWANQVKSLEIKTKQLI